MKAPPARTVDISGPLEAAAERAGWNALDLRMLLTDFLEREAEQDVLLLASFLAYLGEREAAEREAAEEAQVAAGMEEEDQDGN